MACGGRYSPTVDKYNVGYDGAFLHGDSAIVTDAKAVRSDLSEDAESL